MFLQGPLSAFMHTLIVCIQGHYSLIAHTSQSHNNLLHTRYCSWQA